MKTIENRYPRRVTRRIIVYIAVCSAVVGLLTTAAQLHFEYDREMSLLEATLDGTERTVRTGVAEALWVHDLKQLRLLLEGMAAHPDIAGVTLLENGGVLMTAGTKHELDESGSFLPPEGQDSGTDEEDDTSPALRAIPVNYTYQSKSMRIGQVLVTTDLDAVQNRILARGRTILTWNLVQTFLVAVFASFVFFHLLTRHVHAIASYLKRLNPTDLGEPLMLDRGPVRTGQRDELDMLVSAINTLRRRLRASQDEVEESRKDLEASERQYRTILNDMLDTYFRTDAAGRIVMASASAKDLLGWPVEELIGRKANELYVNPDDHARFMATFAAQGGLITGHEEAFRRRDGSVVWGATSARMIYDEFGTYVGAEGIVRDITEQRTAAAAIRDSERQLRLMADSVPALILYVDRDLNFRFANQQAASWYSRPLEDVLKMDLGELFDPVTRARLEPYWKKVFAGEPQAFSETLPYPDGRTRHVEVRFVPHQRADDEIEGFFALIIDVTEQRALEERLRQSQKMEALGQLTGGVAHDFNNLLGIILGNVELLLEEPEMEADEREYLLQSVFRVGNRGAGLTRQLLAFSRQQPLSPSAVQLGWSLPDFTGMLERTLGEGVEIDIRQEGDAWPCFVDRPLLENALLNLALNARDAMGGNGRLSICTSGQRITNAERLAELELARGDYVVVEVSDTGCGMSEDVVAHAWEPFYTTKDVGRGTGLGLSMVYGFVRQSGGGAELDSTPGEGTTVRLYLPRASAAGVEVAASGGEGTDAAQGDGERILIVEDDGDMRRIAEEILARMGYDVTAVEDGPCALEMLGASGPFDLMLTDIRLPNGMLGTDVAEAAWKIDRNLPVVYMTGFAEAPLFENSVLAAEAIVLRKPFRRADLVEALQQVFNGRDTQPPT